MTVNNPWDAEENAMLIAIMPEGTLAASRAINTMNRERGILRTRSRNGCKAHAAKLRREGVKVPTKYPDSIKDPNQPKVDYMNSRPPSDRKFNAKFRKCLKCRDEFWSAWEGYRLCQDCKKSADWQSQGLVPYGSTGRRI